jgi:hypothetical protein
MRSQVHHSWRTAFVVLCFPLAVIGWPTGMPRRIRSVIQDAVSRSSAPLSSSTAASRLDSAASSSPLSGLVSLPPLLTARLGNMAIWDSAPQVDVLVEQAHEIWRRSLPCLSLQAPTYPVLFPST